MIVRRSQYVVIAGISLCLFAASVQWFAEELRNWPGVLMERALNRKEVVLTSKLLEFWEQNKVTGQNVSLPGSHPHLPGLVGYTLVRDNSISVFRRAEILLQAEQATRKALNYEPADARAWARLAWFLDMRKGSTAQLIAALRMSIYVAPADAALVFWRLQMAAKYRAAWDRDFEDLLVSQVKIGWRVSPSRLVQIVKAGKLLDWARIVLNRNSVDDDLFEYHLNQ